MQKITIDVIKKSYFSSYKKEKLKLNIKLILYKKYVNAIIDMVNSDTRLVRLFDDNYAILLRMLFVYISRSISIKQRVTMITKDMDFALRYFPNEFFHNKSVILSEINTDFSINLRRNCMNCMEGMWQIDVCYKKQMVYWATFSIGEGYLVIGSIQGGNISNIRELIKLSTKQLYGLRPQQLIVWLLLEIAKLLDIDRVTGVGFETHIKTTMSRRLRRKNIFFIDYDTVWLDYNGIKMPNKFWHIPAMKLKAIEDVASKKRSMYRKRYAMFEKISSDIKLLLEINK